MNNQDKLARIYFDVFGRDIDITSSDDRMAMQKAVFFIQESGKEVGDYSFSWYKRGPYSQNLQYDILDIKNSKSLEPINYKSESREIIENLKIMIGERDKYNVVDWLIATSSLLYLKKYMTVYTITKEELLNKFAEKFPSLNDEAANKKALESVIKFSEANGDLIRFYNLGEK